MKENQRFTGKIGQEYDLLKLSLPHLDIIEKETVEFFSNFFTTINPLRVLEIGFGTGITSQEILKDERVYLFGIDIEPIMLSQAHERLKNISKERFELHIIDALEYLKEQPDRCFDAVISVWVLHNIKSDVRFLMLKEIYRTLKDGGIFVNGDKIAVSDMKLHKEHLDWQLKKFDIYNSVNKPELKEEWVNHYLEDERPERILYENIFIDDLKNLGFKNIKTISRYYLDAIIFALK